MALTSPININTSPTSRNQLMILTYGSFGKEALTRMLNEQIRAFDEFEQRVGARPNYIRYFEHPWTGALERVLTQSQKEGLITVWPDGLPVPVDVNVGVIPLFMSIHFIPPESNRELIIAQYQQALIDLADYLCGDPDNNLTQAIFVDYVSRVNAIMIFKPVMDLTLGGV